MIVLITPTADRPSGLDLCEQWMIRQSLAWDRWIVADGGVSKCTPRLAQEHLLVDPQPRGFKSLCTNLIVAVEKVGLLGKDDVVLIIEDDDYYKPSYIEDAVARIEQGVQLTGPRWLTYYNVKFKAWMKMTNVASAPLCGTAIRGDALPYLAQAAKDCIRRASHHVDGALWKMPLTRKLHEDPKLVGMKGLPGNVGIGIGHDPRRGWTQDPQMNYLSKLLGEDAKRYAFY